MFSSYFTDFSLFHDDSDLFKLSGKKEVSFYVGLKCVKVSKKNNDPK